MGEALGRWCARRPWATVIIATAVVALPLLVALGDLGSSHWYPVLDLAMTEFRVRDAFGEHTPLIGLPGRIGEYPNQGSHPGPLSFYLLAPMYRLLGSTSWALEAATVAIHVAAIVTALWIGQRRAGWRGVVGVAALLAVAIRGYGQLLLTQPWNPYLPLLAWLVVLLATWSVLCGDSLMLVPLVVAASLCAQTHVPYLLPCAVLTIGSLAFATWHRGHGRLNGRGRWVDRNVVTATALGSGAVGAAAHRPGDQRSRQHPHPPRPLRRPTRAGARHRRWHPPGAPPPRRVGGVRRVHRRPRGRRPLRLAGGDVARRGDARCMAGRGDRRRCATDHPRCGGCTPSSPRHCCSG